jgi:hypothetical protein
MEKGRCVGWPILIRGRQPPLPRPPRLIQARGARDAGNSGLLGDPWMRRATQGGRARGADEQQPLATTSSAPTLTLNPAQLCLSLSLCGRGAPSDGQGCPRFEFSGRHQYQQPAAPPPHPTSTLPGDNLRSFPLFVSCFTNLRWTLWWICERICTAGSWS